MTLFVWRIIWLIGLEPVGDKMKIACIDFGSEEYQAELALRNEILRRPIGLDLYSEDLSKEGMDCHLGAFIDGAAEGHAGRQNIHREALKTS